MTSSCHLYDEFPTNEPLFRNVDLTIVNMNIRSLRSNLAKFQVLMSQLSSPPDIIVLTETWINDCEIGLYNYSNEYNTFYKCNNVQRAGGVIVFVHKSLKCFQRPVNVDGTDSIILNITHHNVSFQLIAMYRLHSTPLINMVQSLANFFSCTSLMERVLMVGDINCDLNQFGTNKGVTDYVNVVSSEGFLNIVTVPTRVTASSATIIDHALFRGLDLNIRCNVYDKLLTDHRLVCLGLNVRGIQKSVEPIVENFVKFDKNKFISHFEGNDWSDIFKLTDVDEIWNFILEKIVIAKNNAYVTATRNVDKFTVRMPWINKKLQQKLDKCDRLLKKKRSRPFDSNFVEYCNKVCKSTKKGIETRRHNYFAKKFLFVKGDSKREWSLINGIMGTKKSHSGPESVNCNGATVVDKNDIANVFNNYFSAVPDELLSKLTVPPKNRALDSCFKMKTCLNSIVFLDILESDVVTAINKMKPSNSTGHDGVSANDFKAIIESVSPLLAYLFNVSLWTSKFPSAFKHAVVVPVCKGGDSEKLDNYRPISLLPIASKLFESIIKTRIVNFLDKTKFFSSRQFGFRHGLSTEDALLDFCSKLYEAYNNNENVAGLFIDIKKAFDTVNHKLLLYKLQCAGIRGGPLDWFASYLDNRSQQVKINASVSNTNQNILSDSLPILHGVPQGSILGPLLFLIYINDLCDGVFEGKLTTFADDSNIVCTGTTVDELVSNLNLSLKAVQYWFSMNFLTINYLKTKCIIFNKPDNTVLPIVKFHESSCVSSVCLCPGPAVEYLETTKFLGITLDSSLSWKHHISELKTKTNNLLRIFFYLKKVCPDYILRTLYFALVESRLTYGIVCWGGTYKTVLQNIYIAQKKLIRRVTLSKFNEHTKPLFEKMQCLPLRSLYCYKVLRVFFLRSGTNVTNPRSARTLNFPLPLPKSESYKKFYTFTGPFIYNKLTASLKKDFATKSSKVFLLNLKKWLLNLNIEDIECWFTR